MCRKMSKTPHMSLLDVFFQALNVPKFVFGQGLRFGPDGGAYAYTFVHTTECVLPRQTAASHES